MTLTITFVIGGARSGKSSFVLNQAMDSDGPKAYIATAVALDKEMAERIGKHKGDRGPEWDTFEEQFKVSDVLLHIKDRYSIVVLDCLTLWLSNILIRAQSTEPGTETVKDRIEELVDTLQKLKKEQRITDEGSRFFIVSNEVGMGIVPENDLAREFRDLAGFLNQKAAEISDEVYLVTAGIPIKIK